MSRARIVIGTRTSRMGELLTEMLSGEPWEVLEADSGDLAVGLVERALPAVVVLEARRPAFDGLEVTRRLRAERRHKLLPVVVFGCESVEERVAALEAGADDLLSSPIERSELVARLRSLIRLKALYDGLEDARRVVFALAKAAEAKDSFTVWHAERVADMACSLAVRLGLDDDAIDQIRAGALIHDVGKIAVPDAILHKPGPLDGDEFAVVKRHPVVGAQIVAPLASQTGLIAIVRSHHERIDGRGYPDGLPGDAIPLAARIVAVCDAFDAMVNVRPYRPAMEVEAALEILSRGRDTQWDAFLVDLFTATVDSRLTATPSPNR